MDGKSKYIVSDILGFYLVEASNPTKAWALHMTHSTSLEDVIAFDKEQLHKYLTDNGYSTIAKTTNSSVYAVS